jgi:hypothetical protein
MVSETEPQAPAEQSAGAEQVVCEAEAEREGMEREQVRRGGGRGEEGREGEGVGGVRGEEAAEERERERVRQGERGVEAGQRGRRGGGEEERDGRVQRETRDVITAGDAARRPDTTRCAWSGRSRPADGGAAPRERMAWSGTRSAAISRRAARQRLPKVRRIAGVHKASPARLAFATPFHFRQIPICRSLPRLLGPGLEFARSGQFRQPGKR